MSTIPLTTTGAELLRQELHRLKTVERPHAITAIAEARTHGDLSENAEYDAAKERQGSSKPGSRRSRASFQRTGHRPEAGRRGRAVRVRRHRRFEETKGGESVTYQIVGDDEADIRKARSRSARHRAGADRQVRRGPGRGADAGWGEEVRGSRGALRVSGGACEA